MAKAVVHKGKTYLMVASAERWVCDGCALGRVNPDCPRDEDLLTCAPLGDATCYILIEDTPKAKAEYFARKVE